MVRFVSVLLIITSTLACSPGKSQDKKPNRPIPEVKAKPFDWPQWRGPDRTAISQETGLLQTWPKDGPPLDWKAKGLGEGYSTPSVSGGRIFTMGNRDKVEYVIALRESDGSELWAKPVGPVRSGGGGYPGPRCTPTVDGGLVYALGLNGDLVCLDVQGEEHWRKDLQSKEFGGSPGGWGYCESPLIDGDRVVVTPGGKKNTLVALNKTNGDLIWSGPVPKGEAAGYSSIVAGTIHGQRQYVQFLSRGVVGLSADKGEFLWRFNEPANGTANISTPLIHDSHVFAASNYGKGGSLAKIIKTDGKFEAEQVYFTDQMQNHHGGMVLVDGYLYGNHGGQLACLKWATGEVAWQSNKPGKGSITYADGCLVYRNEGGAVVLVKATPREYLELGRFSQPDRGRNPAWAHPVIANGKLYIADQDTLFCYDVKK